MTLRIAREQAKKLAARVQNGEDPSGERKAARQGLTVRELSKRFLSDHARTRLKPRTGETYEGHLDNHILPALGSRKVSSLTGADVDRLHRRVKRKRSGSTANRVVQTLSSMISAAMSWGMVPRGENPCRGVKKFKETGRERYLDADERARLWAALEASESARPGTRDYLAPGYVLAFKLLALTGARLSEILDLECGMVDFDRRMLRLPDSKTGAKEIPISSGALDLLRPHRRRRRAELVCTGENGSRLLNPQRAWSSLTKRSRLQGVRLHDLRHSWASDAISDGVPVAVVANVLGHKDRRTTDRYAHPHHAETRRAVEQTGARIAARSHATSSSSPVLATEYLAKVAMENAEAYVELGLRLALGVRLENELLALPRKLRDRAAVVVTEIEALQRAGVDTAGLREALGGVDEVLAGFAVAHGAVTKLLVEKLEQPRRAAKTGRERWTLGREIVRAAQRLRPRILEGGFPAFLDLLESDDFSDAFVGRRGQYATDVTVDRAVDHVGRYVGTVVISDTRGGREETKLSTVRKYFRNAKDPDAGPRASAVTAGARAQVASSHAASN